MKTGVVQWTAIGLLGIGTVVGLTLYQKEKTKSEDLERQLAELTQKERQSVVVQHISSQMEEIAREQQIISDEQRKAAEDQTIVANEMRRQAEVEQQKAQEAEQQARLSESKAVEASNIAETQRRLAVERQHEAEYSRSVADTLGYLAMARSLGSMAITQRNTGNHELASMLAYAAYAFTKRYKGDVYQSAIYEALALTSENNKRWNIGHGALMKTCFMPNDKSSFMAISTYGEITMNNLKNGHLQTEMVFFNKQYDFRDLLIDDDATIYALSSDGHLLTGRQGALRDLFIQGASHAFRLFRDKANGLLIVISEQAVHVMDGTSLKPLRTLPLNFKTRVAGKDIDGSICLFDTRGMMYVIDNQYHSVTPRILPFNQPVMSFAYHWTKGYKAYGTYDGTIYLVDNKGKVKKLVGHRSRVSRITFDDNLLYSTSYDGTARFWNINNEKIEPMTILKSNQWLVCFTFDQTSNYIWTGDQNGNINQTMISADLMAEKVHATLKRDFTPQEWDYYIGNQIPFESFTKYDL